MENGFAAPLLFQIAEDFRRHLPEIFLDYPLFQMWAFKYDSSLQGIQMHADVAAVNLNFWITPDEANLEPESGGLVIWNKEAPQDWNFQDYNSGSSDRQSRITEFLKSSGAERITVPYRQNRAVLFNSDLFHSTDESVSGKASKTAASTSPCFLASVSLARVDAHDLFDIRRRNRTQEGLGYLSTGRD